MFSSHHFEQDIAMNYYNFLILSFGLLLLLIVASILYKKGKKFVAIIIFLFSLLLALLLVVDFLRFLPDFVRIFFSMIFDSIPVIIAILITFRFFSSYLFKGLFVDDIPDYSVPTVLRDSISKILDSEYFLTILRSSLPKGKDDILYGFDHIPFMLNSIDERRKRALKSARLFLIATVCATLIFSGVVMYFGYILVNEASAGTAKRIADIQIEMGGVSETLGLLLPNYYKNPRFQQEIVPKLDKLSELEAGEKNKQSKDKVQLSINQAKSTGDFSTMNKALSQISSEISKDGISEQMYSKALVDVVNSISKFESAQSLALPELNRRVEDLKNLIPKAQDSLNNPENHIPEILKRLALGIVIATFFLALLRYLGNLYRTRYQQVLAAEYDDFLIRRFYVAFKCSGSSEEQRKAVLASFISAQNFTSASENKESSTDGTKQEYEILKELLGALSKKI